VLIPERHDFKPVAFGFQKDSPLLGPFNFYIRQMRERGALNQIIKKYKAQPQACPDFSGKPLGFENCFTAFAIVLGGFSFALLLYLMEMLNKVLLQLIVNDIVKHFLVRC